MNENIIGFICIPHQQRTYFIEKDYADGNPPNKDNYDNYFEGDHDLHSIYEIACKQDLEDLLSNYKGHQWVKVHCIAEYLIDEYYCEEYPEQ